VACAITIGASCTVTYGTSIVNISSAPVMACA
jgi:hypothetical protein